MSLYDHDDARTLQTIKTNEIRVEMTLETPGGPVRIGGRYLSPADIFSDPRIELGSVMGVFSQITRQMEDQIRTALGLEPKAAEEERRFHERRRELRAEAIGRATKDGRL